MTASSEMPGALSGGSTFLERRFGLAERGTDIATEVRAGLSTFMVMSYIVVVNAVVLTSGSAA